MNRLTSSLALIVAASLSQGCATSRSSTLGQSKPLPSAPAAAAAGSSASLAPAADCNGPGCAADVMRIAQKTEVPVEKNAPSVPDHPLTSVVVTQCNLIVAVYMTMPDGRLLRFDHTASVPADQLLQMAYTATRSERVEVSCEGEGAAGYEKHEPV